MSNLLSKGACTLVKIRTNYIWGHFSERVIFITQNRAKTLYFGQYQLQKNIKIVVISSSSIISFQYGIK